MAVSPFQPQDFLPLQAGKFSDREFTLTGAARARVAMEGLETLWFNTGTLCNITCVGCYIESSPRNDALVYLTADEVGDYLGEIASLGLATWQIGFTGGEPFMNPEIVAMLNAALEGGRQVLVLTNAMRPMRRFEADLLALNARHGAALTLRVSLDHYTAAIHDAERGAGAWRAAINGLQWLSDNGFSIAIAGRQLAGETQAFARGGYAALLDDLNIVLDVNDPARLVLFPEMDARADVVEISQACWDILGISPRSMMCATSRMVVKRKGAARPAVIACTLTPYDSGFEMGGPLSESMGEVALNHPHCARFCVLGGASCSNR
ncbi:MAG TPA: radical SAM protein [Caulobacteraceae bacterium]